MFGLGRRGGTVSHRFCSVIVATAGTTTGKVERCQKGMAHSNRSSVPGIVWTTRKCCKHVLTHQSCFCDKTPMSREADHFTAGPFLVDRFILREMLMERRWSKVRPIWVPESFEVDKPTSEYIREWAIMRPEGIAIKFYGQDITYGALNSLIDRAAQGLVQLGVRKGDRVAVHMDNCPQFIIAYFSIQRAGGVVVPVNPMLKQAELEHELNDAGIETLIGLDSLYEEVAKARPSTPLKRVILSSLAEYFPKNPVLPLPQTASKKRPHMRDTIRLTELIANGKDEPICLVDDMRNELALLQYTGGTSGTPRGHDYALHARICEYRGHVLVPPP